MSSGGDIKLDRFFFIDDLHQLNRLLLTLVVDFVKTIKEKTIEDIAFLQK
jgi:hypothetical protein